MKFSNFFSNFKKLGIQYAFRIFLKNHVHCIGSSLTNTEKIDNIIKKYIKKKYSKTINKFVNCDIIKKKETDKKTFTIWVCWWQGEENMPQIVKYCYQDILKHANGNIVILLTKENFHNHVTIPDYILRKVHEGKISLAHFSDILRICLLYEHGGLWLDATVFLTAPLEHIPYEFYSLKCENDLWENINKKRWLIFFFYSSPHSILTEFLRSIIFEYWKKHNFPICYYLTDYLIDVGYDTIPCIKTLIDNIPISNAIPHFIQYNFNKKYDPDIYNRICSFTHFHKFNWKNVYRKYTENGELTYYGYIIQLWENNV